MNKKGFTLVELLAVIVLISIIATIGTVSIGGAQRKMQKKMFEEQLDFAVSAAQRWGETQTFSDINGNKKTNQITIEELIKKGYYKIDKKCSDGNLCLEDPLTGTNVNAVELMVYKKNGRIYACIDKTNSPTAITSNVEIPDVLLCEKVN